MILVFWSPYDAKEKSSLDEIAEDGYQAYPMGVDEMGTVPIIL